MGSKVEEYIEYFKSQEILVFKPGDTEYERSVATPNLLYRFSRPDFVLQPKEHEHVQTIIKYAKAKFTLTIKCGGHSYAGHSTAFKGALLDLREMKTVNLDMTSKTVTFDAGCEWGHVYKELINLPHDGGDGFVINGGRCPFVGVGGFTLGGGLGPFSRTIGMGCDTLEEAKVVTADGELITVKKSDDGESKEGQLFWALCGAGGGNFGVVVEMKLSVAELRNKEVVAGRYQWFADKNDGDLMDKSYFMPTMNEFYTTKWPEHMTIDSTWICDLRQNSGNGVRFLTYFDGSKVEFDTIIDEYIEHEKLAKQLKRRSQQETSTRFLHETLVAQWSEETVRAFPSNRTYSIYSSFVFKNDLPTIEKVTALIRARMIAFREAFTGERVEFLATWIHSGGKTSAREPTDSAFFWREAVYHVYLTVEWEDKWMEGEMRGFLGKAKKKLRPLSLQGEAAYVNFPDDALLPGAYEKAYFGDNHKRLRDIKKTWDEHNFFDWTQGVRLPPVETAKPSASTPSTSMLSASTPSAYTPFAYTANLSPFTANLSPFTAKPSASTPSAYTANDEDLTDSLARKQWEHYKRRIL